MTHGLMNVLVLVPVFLFCLCLHEYAHGWVANRLGDPTAKEAGRLTLHPLAHADLFGTLLLPSLCIYYGLPFIGWAKPVPVDMRHFKNPRRGMAYVAAAGPLSNLFLAGVAAAVLAFSVRTDWMIGEFNFSQALQILSLLGIQVNLFLAIFNLIPIPPLDGFNVLQAVLPARWAAGLYRFAPYSAYLLLALLLTGGLRVIGVPVAHLYRSLVGWVT